MTTTDVIDELHEWLKQAWDPNLTLREWWARLAESGWSQPHWPVEWFGKGCSPPTPTPSSGPSASSGR